MPRVRPAGMVFFAHVRCKPSTQSGPDQAWQPQTNTTVKQKVIFRGFDATESLQPTGKAAILRTKASRLSSFYQTLDRHLPAAKLGKQCPALPPRPYPSPPDAVDASMSCNVVTPSKLIAVAETGRRLFHSATRTAPIASC